MPSSRNPFRRLALALATVAVALVAAPAAQAATAEVTNGAAIYDVDLSNIFAQTLTISLADDRILFNDTGPENGILRKAKTGCEKDSSKVLSCSTAGVNRIKVELENLDDVATVGTGITLPVTFSMGQGGDQATGGPADDTFLGGALPGLGNDTFEGKGGNDTFFGGPNQDIMKGEEGAADKLDLSARILRQAVSLDDTANDGDPSDLASLDTAALSGADDVRGIEVLIGGSARDTFVGDNNANVLDGRGSKDTLEGRGGPDAYLGGDGNDEILARGAADGVADRDVSIDCGGGNDTVEMDPEDDGITIVNCENLKCGNCEIPPKDSPPGTQSPAPSIAAIDPPGTANDADEGTGQGGGGPRPDPDGAGPQPAPPTLAPQVEIVSDGVVPLTAAGKIPVRIVCIYRANRCKGSLTLRLAKAISARIGGRLRTLARNAVIGRANLAPIRWGNSAPVPVQANALFRAILPRLRRPNTLITAALASQDTDGGANAPTARATGGLIVSAKKPARRRGR